MHTNDNNNTQAISATSTVNTATNAPATSTMNTDTNAPAPGASASLTSAEIKSKYLAELTLKSPEYFCNMLAVREGLKAHVRSLGPNARYLALGLDEMALLFCLKMVMGGTRADPDGENLHRFAKRLGSLLPLVQTTMTTPDFVHKWSEVLKVMRQPHA